MSGKFKIPLSFIVPMWLVACSSNVDCGIIAYHSLDAPSGETVRVIHQDTDVTNTPEFNDYAAQLLTRLVRIGYVRADGDSADLTFAISYDFGEDPQKTTETASCHKEYRFRDDEYGSPYYRGLDCYPHDGDGPSKYIHFLRLKVHDEAAPGDLGEAIYEGTVHNMSMSDNLREVMPYLIAALLDNFPGENGEIRNVIVDRAKQDVK